MEPIENNWDFEFSHLLCYVGCTDFNGGLAKHGLTKLPSKLGMDKSLQ